MLKKVLHLSFLSLFVFMVGCASIMDGSTQNVSVSPMSGGKLVLDSTCTVSNSKGSWVVPGGSSVSIKKSRADLSVNCRNNNSDAVGYATAPRSTNVGWAVANFFIWDFCTISCIIDFGSGSIYEYPNQVIVPLSEGEAAVPAAGPVSQR